MSQEAKFLRHVKRATRSPEISAQSDWTDFSSLSTVVGWSVFNTKLIDYIHSGRLVFVRYYIAGTSNAASASFTLPYSQAGAIYDSLGIAQDNGGAYTTGLTRLQSGVATLTTSPGGGVWTASGNKVASGEFWYVAG